MSGCFNESSGGGALTQLVAIGAVDAYLNSENDTLWKKTYRSVTNFAMAETTQQFTGSVAFGGSAQLTLNRNADLIHFMYCVVDLPGISACQVDQAKCGVIPMFPACDFPCDPAKKQDNEVYDMYLGTSEAENLDENQRHAIGKARFQKDVYGACVPLECCDCGDDCPDGTCNKMLDMATGNQEDFDGPFAYWTNAVGQRIIESTRVTIGGSTIQNLTFDYLWMWEELTGAPGRRLQEMVGKAYNRIQLLCNSRAKRRLYVPLPFFFSTLGEPSSSLSLSSLQFHGVNIHVQFASLKDLIITSKPTEEGKVVQVVNCETGCCLTASDLQAHLLTTYVYLDTVERDLFATNGFEVLIQQVQSHQIQSTSAQVRMNLTFNHPIIELIWGVRRKAQEACNNWFNYSGISNMDPIKCCSLALNNQNRFNHNASYFRLVQPYQHHTNIPSSFTYCYSFAYDPQSTDPTGACNFSRIDNVTLNVILQDHLGGETVTIIVFARGWNVLRFREGLAGLAYSNDFNAVSGAISDVDFA